MSHHLYIDIELNLTDAIILLHLLALSTLQVGAILIQMVVHISVWGVFSYQPKNVDCSKIIIEFIQCRSHDYLITRSIECLIILAFFYVAQIGFCV